MIGTAVLMAASLLGSDAASVGCKRMPDGSLQLIVQIQPERFEDLRSGRFVVEGEIRRQLEGLRSYQFRVGTGPLPRDDELAPPAGPAKTSQASDRRTMLMVTKGGSGQARAVDTRQKANFILS